jgi:glycine/D-amino acid oxidase-like deaminating enzyme
LIADTAVPELVETIVIGGGQAGLAISYHLAQRDREHADAWPSAGVASAGILSLFNFKKGCWL